MKQIKTWLEDILVDVEKPTRYLGNELNAVVKDHVAVDLRVALVFPDLYEIGMSHLGLKILYHFINRREDILAERAYSPWVDMEEKMRQDGIPLFSLETKTPLSEFDIVAFTLQYELSYSNILNALELAGIPLLSSQRDGGHPLIIAGGPNAFNPEPLAGFMDLFYLGEGEAFLDSLLDKIILAQQQGIGRDKLLKGLAGEPGLYIPNLYRIEYDEKGRVEEIKPEEGAPARIDKVVVQDLDRSFYPANFIVPYQEVVHERVMLEVARGCTRGCRFCQAGMVYRPVRERSLDTLLEQAEKLVASTGYEEISLVSLSSSDYTHIKELSSLLLDRYADSGVSISLPSLRVDSFSLELAKEVQQVRKTGLTFAPEAGSQRLRDVINKGVTEDDLMETVDAAFREGWSQVKLYFMLGLPTETDEDLEEIIRLARKVRDLGRDIVKSRGRGYPKVTVSASNFVPKAGTPFQWEPMVSREEILRKQRLLKKGLRGRGLKFSWHDADTSLLEGVFARGDRRLGKVLQEARGVGSKFDGWSEVFSIDRWQEAFNRAGLSLESYLRERGLEETLPWEHLNSGVSRRFLLKERERALAGEATMDCREGRCTGCDCCMDLGCQMDIKDVMGHGT
ncbi:MAG: TIGR03960 family B12-binding radical SAM protein [Halanaerobium sp.]|nr:TIGR03960 family B12-binding radical SAM protein [Halanaerobium sp.]